MLIDVDFGFVFKNRKPKTIMLSLLNWLRHAKDFAKFWIQIMRNNSLSDIIMHSILINYGPQSLKRSIKQCITAEREEQSQATKRTLGICFSSDHVHRY